MSSVVVCTWGTAGGALPAGVEEVLTLGRRLGASSGADLTWLVIGPLPERALEVAGAYGAAAVDRIEEAGLEEFRPDAYVEALSRYCAARSPLEASRRSVRVTREAHRSAH